MPKVSFIIPTLNAQHILPRCLQAIRNQSYPYEKVEVIVADGGSKDKTVQIAKKYGAIVINNPEVLHEPGKSRASQIASGDIIFYTDADNILSHDRWIQLMVSAFQNGEKVTGFLPQTIPAPDSNPIDRYLGYLFTDPFTWFVYYPSASPTDFSLTYTPIKETKDYVLYRFETHNPPLFGLSQGVGTLKTFSRTAIAHADDMMAGIKLIREGGIVAYVPNAGVYHYHVSGLINFLHKYAWRLRNNFTQQVRGMGLIHRTKYFPLIRKVRIVFFIPYALSIVGPLVHSIKLTLKHRDPVMLLHVPMTMIMALIIIWEGVRHIAGIRTKLGDYA